MRFISWNVNGIRAAQQHGFLETIQTLAPDVFAVQETKAKPDQLSPQLLEVPGYTSYWNSAQKNGYSGVGVYARQKPLSVAFGINSDKHDAEGRAITLEYEDFFLINLYFPNAQPKLVRMDFKMAFNEAVSALAVRLASQKTVVLCGDFNVAHKPIDLANPASNENNPGFSPQERAWMDRFLAAGHVDTFRMFEPGKGHYTWWSYRSAARTRNVGWRIDYFCVDEKSKSRVKNAFILPEVMGSDHCPVGLDFE